MRRRNLKQDIPFHEKLKSISTSISLLVTPVIIAFVGNVYTSEQSESKLRSEYINMGIRLLAEKPTENNKEVRRWAIDLINHYSEVKFKPEVKNELQENSFLLSILEKTNDHLVNYPFEWEGLGDAVYALEVEKNTSGKWVGSTGLSVVGNKTMLSVPANTRLRWRYGRYQELNGGIVYNDWKELYIER